MKVLVIGGDRLGSIEDKLRGEGFNKIAHITGRKKGDVKVKIPQNMDLVLVLTDYIGHNMAEVIKKRSKKSNMEIMFCKRSWVSMHEDITNYMNRLKISNM